MRRAHFSGDVSKLATIIANYTFESLFTIWILHLEGEEVFGFAKHDVDFLLRVDDESRRPNCINFSHPCVAIFAYQPNSVDNLPVPKSPCVAQSMFPLFFQGGITINEIMCGDGL